MFFDGAKVKNENCFAAKRDKKSGLVVGVILAFVTTASYFNSTIATYRPLIFLVMIFMGWIWYGTGYCVGKQNLLTWSGPFRKRIYIKSILRIEKTKNIIGAPALSLDALKLISENKIIIVSPEDQELFIKALLSQNPNIKVEV